MKAPTTLIYFSDMLCVWAYIAQVRIDEVKANFGSQIRIEHRFCPVFSDAHRKITTDWAGRGEFEGFNAHLRHAVSAFPEIDLNPDIWKTVRPSSSMGIHVFLKAAQLAEPDTLTGHARLETLMWALRCAFFRDGRDIARRDVQREIGARAGADVDHIDALIQDGRAFAALGSDYRDAEAMAVKGSPTLVLNEGRQKLYGNIGYRIIEANIQELLRDPNPDQASWC